MTSDIGTLRPGDRIRITHAEFPAWKPTWATVRKIGIRFPDTPAFRQLTVMVRLDEHPFPKVAWQRMSDFGWGEGDPHISWEAE